MATVQIYQSAKKANQSGDTNSKIWKIDFVPSQESKSIDPLTGWFSSGNTTHTINLEFESLEVAENYAIQNEYEYTIDKTPKIKKHIIKSYASNFSGPKD